MSGVCGVSTWFELLLRPQVRVTGRWHGRSYTIVRELGRGAIGVVFLVERDCQSYAMKVSSDNLALQSEINALQSLRPFGKQPFLLETDDFLLAGQTCIYYIMRFVDGVHFREFLLHRGPDWLPALGINVLERLRGIHEQGYVFGDLKSDNLIVATNGRPELIDYGGVTAIGRSLRQFSERYDRAFWQAGSRVADPAYDILSFAIVCIECLAPHSFNRLCELPGKLRTVAALLKLLDMEPALRSLRRFFRAAILGQLRTSRDATQLWLKLVRLSPRVTLSPPRLRWLKIVFACTIFLFTYTVIRAWP